MDCSKLSVGMVIDNYKELCGIIQEPIKGGKSKQYQEVDFERYFSWERDKHKYIITNVYDTPLEKVDKRHNGNRNIYCSYIECILLKYLSMCDGHSKTMTPKSWWRAIGIINDKYIEYFKSQDSSSELPRIYGNFNISDFICRSNYKITRLFNCALNSLKNKKLIHFEEQYVIAYKQSGVMKFDVAEDYEIEELLSAERTIMHDVMGYSNMSEVYLHRKQKQFYDAVYKYIEDLYGYSFYFKQIKIVSVNKELLKSAITDEECLINKSKLQEEIKKFLNEEAEKNYNRAHNKCQNLNGYGFDYSQDYVTMQYQIANALICDNNKYTDCCEIEDNDYDEIFDGLQIFNECSTTF